MKYLEQQKIKAECLELLLNFDRICKKLDIEYSLAYGTLLGSIRHEGFIPWDDDIDVVMLREDYNKFCRDFSYLNDNKGHGLISSNKNEITLPFSKVVNKSIKTITKGLKDGSDSFLSIDIFPFDGVSKNILYKYISAIIVYISGVLLQLSKLNNHSIGKLGLSAYYLKHIISFVFKTKSSRILLVKGITSISRAIPAKNADFIGATSRITCYGLKDKLKKEKFLKKTLKTFEGYEFPVMEGWHEYLTNVYGDYMQLPPLDKRVNHNFKAYKIDNKEKRKV